MTNAEREQVDARFLQMTQNYDALLQTNNALNIERKRFMEQRDRLAKALRDISEEECQADGACQDIGDDGPPCTVCKAREALKGRGL